jgi:integrase
MWDQARLGIKQKHSWQEAVVRWLSETSDKATHHQDISKLTWLHKFLGKKLLDEITLDDIDAIRQSLLKDVKKSTVNRYLALVRSILIRARDEWDWVERVPKVKLFKEPAGRVRFITPEQAEQLLSELPQHQLDMVMFALQTGLRQSNVFKLEWSNINLEKCHMWVNSDDSKNGKPIAVPLNKEAMAVLNRLVGRHPTRVFTYNGKPLGSANTRAWRSALKRAGITDFRWHDLRHTWASWHRMQGTATHELQQLGGWKTSAMVERYAHLSADHLANAAARLNAVTVSYDPATV